MSLSLCKKSHLAERTGKEVLTVIQTPWPTVNKSALENAGLESFTARRFEKSEVVTIYHAPKKSKQPIDGAYVMKYHGWYHTVPVIGIMKCLHTIWMHISSTMQLITVNIVKEKA